MNPSMEYRENADLDRDSVLRLYRANHWSSADKPDNLIAALRNSDNVITAWHGDQLIGLANAISDGHLVVYYPHVVVHPEYHRRGIGREMMTRLMQHYDGFHQHAVLADPESAGFYEASGFEQSPCTAMWIYDGDDH